MAIEYDHDEEEVRADTDEERAAIEEIRRLVDEANARLKEAAALAEKVDAEFSIGPSNWGDPVYIDWSTDGGRGLWNASFC